MQGVAANNVDLITRFYDPLVSKSDRNPVSPYKISTLSSKQVTRVKTTINTGIMSPRYIGEDDEKFHVVA